MRSENHAITQSYNHVMTKSCNHTIMQSYNQSYNHAIMQSYNHTLQLWGVPWSIRPRPDPSEMPLEEVIVQSYIHTIKQ